LIKVAIGGTERKESQPKSKSKPLNPSQNSSPSFQKKPITSIHQMIPPLSYIPASRATPYPKVTVYFADLLTLCPKLGFSPLKPAADICTTWLENYSIPLIFMMGRKGWEIGTDSSSNL